MQQGLCLWIYKDLSNLFCKFLSENDSTIILSAFTQKIPNSSYFHSLNITRHGYLKLIQWMYKNHCFANIDICAEAAAGGYLDILKWARLPPCGSPAAWNELTCCYAAEGGHLEILGWARANGAPWNEWTCSHAAASGHLKVLQWAITNGCPWDASMFYWIYENKLFTFLDWMRENGYEVIEKEQFFQDDGELN